MLIKYIFFTTHALFILACLLDIFRYNIITFLQFIAILSWHFNDNDCFITQLEDILFKETLIDVYYRLRGVDGAQRYYRYRVPSYQRFTIYILFTMRICEIIYIICVEHIIKK